MRTALLCVTATGLLLSVTACHSARPAALTPARAPGQSSLSHVPPKAASRHSGGAAIAPAANPMLLHADSVRTEVRMGTPPAPAALTAWHLAAPDSATVADRIHFAFDRSELTTEDVTQLEAKRAVLAANANLDIRILGNCDERGSDEYNLALGERRAAAAKRWLTSYGIAANRISITSYGAERPLDRGHNEAAWAANRRDEFVVTGTSR